MTMKVMKRSSLLAASTLCAQLLLSSAVSAQLQGGVQAQGQFPQQQFPQQQFPQQQFPQQQVSRERTSLEIGALYGVSAAYGVGMGIWLSTEVGIKDPALFLIPPAILGVAGPVGVYFFDRTGPHRGVPAAIATGTLIGADEGLGI